jgi:hypothetical protein
MTGKHKRRGILLVMAKERKTSAHTDDHDGPTTKRPFPSSDIMNENKPPKKEAQLLVNLSSLLRIPSENLVATPSSRTSMQ